MKLNHKCRDCEKDARYVFHDLEEDDMQFYCTLHWSIRCIRFADYPNVRSAVARMIQERN